MRQVWSSAGTGKFHDRQLHQLARDFCRRSLRVVEELTLLRWLRWIAAWFGGLRRTWFLSDWCPGASLLGAAYGWSAMASSWHSPDAGRARVLILSADRADKMPDNV